MTRNTINRSIDGSKIHNTFQRSDLDWFHFVERIITSVITHIITSVITPIINSVITPIITSITTPIITSVITPIINSLYENSDDDPGARDSPFKYNDATCDCYRHEQTISKSRDLHRLFSYFHLNCHGLSTNWDSFRDLICQLRGESFAFEILGTSEIFKCIDDTRLSLPIYHQLIMRCRHDGARGGVGGFYWEKHKFFKFGKTLVSSLHVSLNRYLLKLLIQTKTNKVIGFIYLQAKY